MLSWEVAMSSQPAPGHPTSVAELIRLAFPRGEWELLTGLPRQVVIAATSAEADNPRRTVAEGIAGLDAIAAGHASDSDLVRAVAAAIYAETGAADHAMVAEEFNNRPAGLTRVLEDCRRATGVLAVRSDPADSAAYRQWVQSVAARVCDAARSGGVLGVGGVRRSEAEQRFLADLGTALNLG
jgi:hypothetical protein